MLTDTRFHRRSNPQGLMNPRKVIVHVKQGDHRNMVLDLLSEGIRQASEAPHVHSHVEILSLDVAGRNVLLIGLADHFDSLGAKTLRRAIPLLSLDRIVAIDLDQLRVINGGPKSIRDSRQIHLVAVRGQLDSVLEPASNVLKELGSTPGVPPSNEPTQHQLGIGVNRGERPDITGDSFLGNLRRYVLLFGVAERPDFVDLNPLGGNVADNIALVLRTGRTHANQQAKDSALRYAGHADGRTNRASFDQRRNDRYLLLRADYVCHDSIVRQRFRIVKRKVAEREILGAFLHFSPSCFSGLPGASPSLFVGHRFKPSLAADPTTLRSHVAHDSLNDGKFDRLRGFNGFQENAPGVLDRIKILSSACPLWHTSSVARITLLRQEARISNRPTTD